MDERGHCSRAGNVGPRLAGGVVVVVLLVSVLITGRLWVVRHHSTWRPKKTGVRATGTT